MHGLNAFSAEMPLPPARPDRETKPLPCVLAVFCRWPRPLGGLLSRLLTADRCSRPTRHVTVLLCPAAPVQPFARFIHVAACASLSSLMSLYWVPLGGGALIYLHAFGPMGIRAGCHPVSLWTTLPPTCLWLRTCWRMRVSGGARLLGLADGFVLWLECVRLPLAL